MSEPVKIALIESALPALAIIVGSILTFIATIRNRQKIERNTERLAQIEIQINGRIDKLVSQAEQRALKEGFERGVEKGWKDAGC